jgi:hypothetical protein
VAAMPTVAPAALVTAAAAVPSTSDA